MKTKFKRYLLRYLIRDLLKAVTIDDLLRVDNGKVFIGKRELTREQLNILKDESENFENTLLWKLMLNNLYWIANYKMIRGANGDEDMQNGRMMTLCIDTIQEFIDRLKTIR